MDGALWWESHAGFTRTKNGRCFIESNVLFLEPAVVVREPGFLIKEYNKALEELPQWTKTPYYCTNYTLRSCHNDKILYNESVGKGLKRRAEEFKTKASVYQLGRYKIIEAESGQLRWNTCTHLDRLKVGRGFINGKILFVNRKIIEESGFSKREFFNLLKQLPKWKKTPYYCTNYTLKPCQTSKVFTAKQYGRFFRECFKYVSDSISTDRKAQGRKKIAEIKTGVTTYTNRFFKRI